MQHTIHSIALASALLALAACSDRDAPDPSRMTAGTVSDTAVMGAPAAGPVAIEKVDDGSIVAKLKAHFAEDPDISAIAIDVDSKGGMVTLSGVVTNTDAKVRADQMAKAMPEVKSVNNQLEVRAG
jgi:hyperosmotically inducible protein